MWLSAVPCNSHCWVVSGHVACKRGMRLASPNRYSHGPSVFRRAVEEVRALHRDASSSASLEVGPSGSSPQETPMQLQPQAAEGAATAQLPSVPEGDAAQQPGTKQEQQQQQQQVQQSRAGHATAGSSG